MSKTQVATADVNDDLMKMFKHCFNLETLVDLADEEEQTTKQKWIRKQKKKLKELGVESTKEVLLKKRRDYEKAYPQTIEYLTNNIFLSDQGAYYINSVNEDGIVMPKEIQDQALNKFKAKFPNDIKTYFEKHCLKVYHIVVSPTDPRIFQRKEINCLNLFQGYKFDGKERKQELCDKMKDGVGFIWQHIFKMWCNSNVRFFQEIKNWVCALIAGRRKMRTAIYLKGKMGIGKGKIVDFLTSIIGHLNCLILNTEHAFTGQFNGQLAGKTLVNLNEIVSTHDEFVSLYNRLKPWVTDDYMSFRDLYSKPIVLKNLCSFILTGNHDMFKIENNTGNDRRFIIVDSCDTLQSNEYYTNLDLFTKNEAVQEAFYWDCVDKYDPNYNEQISIKSLPITETKQNMILKTLSTVTQFLKSRMEENGDYFNNPFKKSGLYSEYLCWHKARLCNFKNRSPYNLHDFCTNLLDEYKDVIQMKQVRINKVPTKDCFIIDGKKLYAFMKKKGYISKFDEIADAYKTTEELKETPAQPEPENNATSFEVEYWTLELQKLELQMKQDVLEMKMLNLYDEFLEAKLKQRDVKELDDDPLEYGIKHKIEVEEKIEKVVESVLSDESKQNLSHNRKMLNAFLGQDLFSVDF
jgi:hypothetical protein